MALKKNNPSSSAEPDAATATLFVEAFDGLLRQIIAPNSHKSAQDLQMGPQDVRALSWLGRRDRCLMTDFARGVGVPLSTATHLANRLVEKGVMLRERSDQDRRVVFIGLSALGKKLDAQFFHLRLSRSQILLARLKPADRQKLVALMQKALVAAGDSMSTFTKEEEK